MKEYIIDVQNRSLGRVASEIALILQGKDDPSYEPRLAGNNRVIVKNIKKVYVTGSKAKEKIYYRHTTRIGSLKKRTYEQIFEKNPGWVLKRAVRLMLPLNQILFSSFNTFRCDGPGCEKLGELFT